VKKLFREEAIEASLVLDKNGQLFNVLSVKSWMFLLFVLCLLFSVFVWFVFGSLSIEVKADGIFLEPDGSIVKVYPSNCGCVKKVLIYPGAIVKKGQPLVVVENKKLNEQIEDAYKDLKLAQGEYKEILKESEYTILLIKNETEARFKEIDIVLEHKFDEISFLKKHYVSAVNMFKHGHLSKIDLDKIKRKLYIAIGEQKELLTKKEKAQFEKQKCINDETVKIKSFFRKVMQSKIVYEAFLEERKRTSVIISNFDGKLTEVCVSIGENIDTHDVVATLLTNMKNTKTFVAFVDLAYGKKIKKGQQVKILPSIANRYINGYINGSVEKVSEFPISLKAVKAVVGDETLAKILSKGSATFKVDISLQSTGFRDIDITEGLIGQVKIITKRKAPISFVISVLS
jgi:multidrug resistance efflux pump